MRCSRDAPCTRCKKRRFVCVYPEPRTQPQKGKKRRARKKKDSNLQSPEPLPAKNLIEDAEGEDGIQAPELLATAPVETEPLGTESVETEPVDTEPADTEPVEAEPRETELATNNSGINDANNLSWNINGSNAFTAPPADGTWPPNDESIAVAPQPMNPMLQIDDMESFQEVPDLTTAIPNINWLSDSQFASLWENQLPIIPEGLGSMAYTFPSELIGPNSVSTWVPEQPLDVNMSIAGPMETPAIELDQTYYPTVVESPYDGHASSINGSNASSSSNGALYVDGTAARAPFRGQLHPQQASLQSNRPEQDPRLPDADEPDYSYLKSLVASMRESSDSTSVPEALYSKLSSVVQNEIGIDPSLNLDVQIPPLENIRAFVLLYYQCFHPKYPFIQKSSAVWQNSDNWILLLAVATTGARYAGSRWSSVMSELLDKGLRHRVDFIIKENTGSAKGIWVPGNFQSNGRMDLQTLQASILNIISRIHSGQEVVMDWALHQRLALVEECRKMDLLSQTLPQTTDTPVQDGDVAVTAWMQTQSKLRTGLMIWVLDTIVSHEFNCPQNLRIVTVLEALHLLYMEKRQPSNLTEFGNIVLIYAVCARTKEAAYQYGTALSRWTPVAHVEPRKESVSVTETWPPTLEMVTRWRNSACDAFDILHWKANGKAANAGGTEHPTILHLHLSRLYILTPTKHFQRVAASAVLRQNGSELQNNIEYSEACNHIQRWANIDQYKARLSIIHAGALLWHVRRYSSNDFIEPHAIYLATLSIWAYSVFNTPRTESQQQRGDEASRSVPVSGDRESQGSVGNNEVESEEEPDPTFIHLDRPCDDEMVQVYIRLGHKMAGHLHRVGNICSPNAPPKILKEGIRMLSHARAKNKEWGIEISYIMGLTSLLHGTTAQGNGRASGTRVF
ncbi:transcription factor ZMS1 [Fusarium pseudocircinatum]|uniref:Transcription factor ZMS1 n=1 Tax=Fusarium pseudocircinatum TaxID=56676 RepID=A0A8H5PMJ7_9HYPO|nr:transcription factor ZMS1 [Fusarium pseudocircinatum]